MAVSTMAKLTPSARRKSKLLVTADALWLLCAMTLLGLVLLGSLVECHNTVAAATARTMTDRPCEEIYVVAEGETLNTISDKCDDPFIVERNPHIHDPDDVFPGLVIRIIPLPKPT